MKDSFYFTLELTENEHACVNYLLEKECVANNLTLHYYRKFKNGHIPCQREVKISGGPQYIIDKILKNLNIIPENYNTEKAYQKRLERLLK